MYKIKFKNILSIIIIGIVLLFIFTGCSSNALSDDSENVSIDQEVRVDDEVVDSKELEAEEVNVQEEVVLEEQEKIVEQEVVLEEQVKQEEILEHEETAEQEEVVTEKLSPIDELIKNNKLIEVDGGNQSGHREPNVIVDVGFGDREYYAYTNEYGQLIKVTAKVITLQDDDNEPVLSTGRYYSDEAKVPGVESPTLDEGHVIADSLGGVSNAYNITPQESTLNRHGEQAYMEKVIRNADGCTDFTAIITYPNFTTQIPSYYSYTYTINGNVIHDEFDNVDPDEANEEAGITTPIENEAIVVSEEITITELDKKAEYIVIKNTGNKSVDLSGWRILSVRGEQSFTFSTFTLNSNTSVKVGDSAKNSDVDFHWLDGRGTWNNSKSDPAELYNAKGELVDRYDD
ncbi:lamin tail domain-containing protein [Clostridiaceae bacterium HSG29]|nr:lamin tail domain-containing protein [Clostridiaceae bacterium HSG29]